MNEQDRVRQVLSAAKRAETIHRRKLFNGRMTPDEVEARWGQPRGAKCIGCNKPPCTSVKVFMPVDEVHKSLGGELLGRLLVSKPREFAALCIQIEGQTYVRASWTFACRRHLPDLERLAAKAPSWCIVDIDRGPAGAATNRVLVGPTSFEAEVSLAQADEAGHG